MNNLYTFNKKGFMAKAFHWLWGVWPHEKFPTMCPYFWSWVGTTFILPFLLLVNVMLRVIGGFSQSPFGQVIETLSENCKAYNKQRKLRNAHRKNTHRAQLIKAFIDNPCLETARPVFDFASTGKRNFAGRSERKFFVDFTWSSKEENLPYNQILCLEQSYKGEKELREWVCKAVKLVDEDWIQARRARKLAQQEAKVARVEKRQAMVEKSVATGKEIGSNRFAQIVMGLGAIVGIAVGVFYLVGLLIGLFWLIVKGLTWWYNNALVETGITLAVVVSVAVCAWTVWKLVDCWGDVIGRGIKTFFSKVGSLFVWIGKAISRGLSHLGWVGNIFLSIGRGFIRGAIIVGNMIYATYKQYCPMITWMEEED